MSDKPPTTPPDRERSLEYATDSQKTPKAQKQSGSRVESILKRTGRVDPYHTPTPEQRIARSRTSSPTPAQRKRDSKDTSAGPSWIEGARGTERDEEDDDEDDDDDIEVDESPPPFLSQTPSRMTLPQTQHPHPPTRLSRNSAYSNK